MYSNLYGDKDLKRTYGEGVMSFRVKEINVYAVGISVWAKRSDGRILEGWKFMHSSSHCSSLLTLVIFEVIAFCGLGKT